jgi:hypothetical protein
MREHEKMKGGDLARACPRERAIDQRAADTLSTILFSDEHSERRPEFDVRVYDQMPENAFAFDSDEKEVAGIVYVRCPTFPTRLTIETRFR